MERIRLGAIAIVTLCLLGVSTAWAQEQGKRGPERGREGPPPEAIEACEGQSEGDACSFQTPHGELEGTCRTPPRQDTLACVPKDHPEGGPRGGRDGESKPREGGRPR